MATRGVAGESVPESEPSAETRARLVPEVALPGPALHMIDTLAPDADTGSERALAAAHDLCYYSIRVELQGRQWLWT